MTNCAMRCYKATLKVEKEALGPYHIDVVQTMIYIAQLHQQLGEIHEAMQCYLEILSIQRRNLPEHDSNRTDA